MHVVGGVGYFGASGYLRKVDLSTGQVSSVAGNGTSTVVDAANPVNARVCSPVSLTDDGTDVFFVDQCGSSQLYLRKMTLPAGPVKTLITPTGAGNIYSGLTTGPGGDIYASSNSLSPAVVVRVDPATGGTTQVATLPAVSDSTRTWLAADSSALWVGTDGCTATSVCGVLFRVDPVSGSVTQVATGLGLAPHALVSAGDYLYAGTTRAGTGAYGALLKRITKSDGGVRLVAGSGTNGFQDGAGAEAWFSGISGLDSDGSVLWVADRGNHRIRKVVSGTSLPAVQPTRWSTTTTITAAASSTLAGGGSGTVSDGTGTAAGIGSAQGLHIVGSHAYFIDSNRLRKVELGTRAVTTVAGNGTNQVVDAVNPAQAKIGAPPTAAMADDGHFLYFLDAYGSVSSYLRRMSLTTGSISTVLAVPTSKTLTGVSVAPNGTVFVADNTNVMRVDPDRSTTTILAPLPGAGAGVPAELAADSTSLWVGIRTLTSTRGGAIYRMDPTTGAATLLPGSTGIYAGKATLTSAGDFLYVVAIDSASPAGKALLRLRKSTGAWSLLTPATWTTDSVNGLDASGSALYATFVSGHRIDRIVQAPTPGPAALEAVGGSNPAQLGDCMRCDGDPIDLNTGDLFESATDLTVPGRGVPLALTRTYDTRRATSNGRLGYGWTDSYNWQLSVDTSATAAAGQVTIRQDNGSQVVFTPDRIGGYTAPSRVLATLAHNADGTWTYTLRRTLTYTFNTSGRLTAIRDRNGYTTTLTYTSGRLTTVTDPAGRTLTFTYDANGRVKTVTDPLPRTVTYSYDTAGNLASVVDADAGASSFGYDSAHRLTSVTDARGNTVTTVYDPASGKATSQTDRRGKTTTFAYTAPAGDGTTTTTVTHPGGDTDVYTYLNGRAIQEVHGAGTTAATTTLFGYDDTTNGLSSTTDGLGHTTATTYDANGNKLTVTDPLGRTTTATYNDRNQPLTVTDPSTVTTTYTYDGNGNPLTVSRPLTGGSPAQAATTTYTYADPTHPGDLTTVTDPRGKTTTYTYDTYGNTTSVTDPTGRKTTTSHNILGWTTTVVTPAGNTNGATPSQHTTSYSNFTGHGQAQTVTDPLGHTTSYGYDANGNLTDVTDPNNRHTHTTYDPADQPTITTRADNTTLTRGYDDNGRLASSTDALGHTTTYGYDAAGRLTTVTDPLGHVTHYGYDAAGRRTTVTDPAGHTTTTGYDAAGQPTSLTDARGKTTTTVYDALGRPTTLTDPDGHKTVTAYDSLGRRTRQDQGTSNPLTTTGTWTYDLAGNLLTDTDGTGHTTSYGYDDAGRPTATTDPLDRTTTTSYDADGRLATTTHADGTTTSHTYDNAGRLTGITYPAGTPSVAYTYDNTGRRTAMTDGTGTTSYTHDTLGRITGTNHTPAAGGTPTTVGYTWDDAGRLTAITYPGNHTLTRGYDNADRHTTVTDWANRTLTYTWANDNTLTTAAYPNGVTTTNTYDPTGNPTGITATTTSGSTVLDLAYNYDNAGLLTTDTDQTNPASPVTTSYGYDPLARINTVTGGPAAGTYTFDNASQLTGAPGNTHLYDAAGQLTNSGTLTNPTTHTHNTLGQRTASTTTPLGQGPATTTYSYDAAGQLTTVTPPSGTSDTHTYNGDGLRATTTHTTSGNTTTDTYTWDISGNLPLLLEDATNTYLYGLGSSPYAQINRSTGAITYLHADQLGSTRTTTNTNGTVTGTWTYDTYGNQTAHTGTTDTPFLYAGQYRDAATGLYYLRARYYDPATGQFLTRDPIQALTRQPYTYADGNPISETDPTGLEGTGAAGQERIQQTQDPWLRAFLQSLFDQYNANHNEAVRLAALRIAQMMPGGTLYADAPGFRQYRTQSGLKPDIVVDYKGRLYYWEVKPNTPYGVSTGRLQLTAYDGCFAGIGSRGTELGVEWAPTMGTNGGLYVHDSGIPGLIYYEKDQKQIVKEAVTVANTVVPERRLIVQPVIVVGVR